MSPDTKLADAASPSAYGTCPEGFPLPLRASTYAQTLPVSYGQVGGTSDVGAGRGEGVPAPANLRQTKLDAGPIIECVNRRGGIARVLGVDHNNYGDPEDADRRVSKDPDLKRLSRQWHRMVQRGWLTVDAADKWCINVLRVNPALVYGQEWWDV